MIADTLRRAALYLIRHGWTQDNHYADAMTPPALRRVPFPAADVLGALVLACTGRTLIPGEVARECGTDADRDLSTAVTYLADWLGLSGELDDPATDPHRDLMAWNDAPWQDQAHIIDGLLAAAADADGSTYIPGVHHPYAAEFAALGLKAATR